MARKAVAASKKVKKDKDKDKKKSEVLMSVADGMAKLSKSFGTTPADQVWDYVPFIDVTKNRPCLPLEYVFGTKGLVTGRVYQFISPEAAGKSSMLLMFIGMAQRAGGCWSKVYESENTKPQAAYVEAMGCEAKNVIIETPTCVDDFVNDAAKFVKEIRANIDTEEVHPIILGLDSLNGLGITNADDDDEEDAGGDRSKGIHARKMSEFFRETYRTGIADKRTVLFVVSQAKQTINITAPGAKKKPDGDGTSTLADKPLRFHCSARIELTHARNYIEKERRYDGEIVTMTLIKNKLGMPNRRVKTLMHGTDELAPGVPVWDWDKATIDLLFGHTNPDPKKFTTTGNGWYSHPELKKGGNMQMQEFLDQFFAHPTLINSVRESWRIYGFGFEFEERFKRNASATEGEDETDTADFDSVVAAAAALPEHGK